MATIRATLQGSMMGSAIYNVVHFRKPDYVTSDLSALADDLDSYWVTYAQAKSIGEMLWLNINVRRVDGGTDPSFNKAISKAGTAGSNSQALPINALVFKLQTDIIGRHGHGRIYFPGVGHPCFQSGLLTAGCLASYQTLAGQWLARYGPGGGSSFVLVIAERADPSTTHDVTSIVVRSTIGTQRRRNFGVGI